MNRRTCMFAQTGGCKVKIESDASAKTVHELVIQIARSDSDGNKHRLKAGEILAKAAQQHKKDKKDWSAWLKTAGVVAQEARRWIRMSAWCGGDSDRQGRICTVSYAEALRIIRPPSKPKEKAYWEWHTIGDQKQMDVTVRHGTGLASINSSKVVKREIEAELAKTGECMICLRRKRWSNKSEKQEKQEKEAPLASSWMDTAKPPEHQTLAKKAGVLRAVAALTTGSSL